MTRYLVYLAIVLVVSLVGLSFSKLTSSDPWIPTVGAALIALVAIGISCLISPGVASLEKTESPKNLLGLRVGIVGFCVAVGGWLLAVFIFHAAGFVVVVIGVFTGFVGMAIHLLGMISPHGKS